MTITNEPVAMDLDESPKATDTRRAVAIDWAFRGLIIGLSVIWLVTLGVSAARGVDTAALAGAVGLL